MTSETLPELPRTFECLFGEVHDPSHGEWRLLRDSSQAAHLTVRVERLAQPYAPDAQDLQNTPLAEVPRRDATLHPTLVAAATLWLIHRAQNHVGHTVGKGLQELCAFDTWVFQSGRAPPEGLRAEDITVAQIRAYAVHLRRLQRRSGGQDVAVFYRWAARRGFPGFEKAVARQVTKIRFPTNRRGWIARSRCKYRGTLEFHEEYALRAAVRKPAHRVDIRDRAIVWFLMETGCRSIALNGVKKAGLAKGPLGDKYFVEIPRVKRRRPSAAVVAREIPLALGRLLEELGRGCDDEFLFAWVRRAARPSTAVRRACLRFVRLNDIRTVRIMAPNADGVDEPVLLPLNPYRFRHTVATGMAEQGASPEQIAAILDDDTVDMALVYTNNTSSIVDRLECTLDQHPTWRRVMNIFLGRVADGDSRFPKIFAGALHLWGGSAILERRLVIGQCRRRVPCSWFPPLSCYRCKWFDANPDPRPHLVQLDQLKGVVKRGVGRESDRMVRVLQPEMLAIVEVVDALREAPSEKQVVADAILIEEV